MSEDGILKSGDFVSVGQEIALQEMYLGDPRSTFVNDGKIYAAAPGIININEKDRVIRVNTQNEAKRIVPKKGDIVIGTVSFIRKHSVGVQIDLIQNKPVIDYGLYGNIHISQASKKYVQSLDDIFEKTDIIRGVILGERGGEWRIATNLPNTGIIHSDCKYCGHSMDRKGRDQLVCSFCKNTERKILASDYGSVEQAVKQM